MHENAIRISIFLIVFFIVAVWELIAPRRALIANKTRRWFTNISMTTINRGLMVITFPVLPVGLAVILKEHGWGLFNILDIPYSLKVILSFIILDFSVYIQHVLMHYLPLFWRLHRMHHTDLDLDVTTGNRFHPIEIALSMCLKLSVVALTGAPALSVILFEIILNGATQFNHGNIFIPEKVDSYLRLVLVTPDMHRVHHSIIPKETNSNFGFALPWWDRLLGTYRALPEGGHTAMAIGLKEYRDPDKLMLWHLLMNPFR